MTAQWVFSVSGMTCNGCAQSIEKALSKTPGVTSCEVDLQKSKATVTATLPREKIVGMIEDLGFEVDRNDGSAR